MLTKMGGPRAQNLTAGIAARKYAEPSCERCQHRDAPRNWYETCRCDVELVTAAGYPEWTAPYFIKRIETVRTPRIRRDEDGRVVVEGWDEVPEVKLELRLCQEQMATRVSSGARPLYAERLLGRRPLEDFGFAPKCDYLNCWADETPEGGALLETPYGRFCREIEAKLVAAGERGRPLEVLLADKRADQLARL